MWKKKKSAWGFALILLVVFLVGGYYVSGIFLYPEANLENFQEILIKVLQNPFQNYWNDKTEGCITVAFLVWLGIIVYYQYYNRNFLSGREHGSAEWAEFDQIMKTKGDKNGRILSQHIRVTKDSQKIANNNMMVIGAPGTGKSFRIVAPNLLTSEASVVVLDVKGDLLRTYGKSLEDRGYRIRCLDLISSDFRQSDCYNPFVYVSTEVDLNRLVENIQKSLTPQETTKGDPFWEDGVTLYLLACFYYVWMEMDYPTIPKVQSLMNEESRVIDEETGETELQRRMTILAVESSMGNEHPAILNYKKLKEGAPDTVRSIIIMCNAKFKFMGVAAAKRIFSDDEMDLQDIGIGTHGDGVTRTALFLCIPDDDRSFDFIIGMMYTQLFHLLIEEARVHGGALPIPVEVWMDEFANGARPDNYEKLITTLRSRNISVIMFLQSVAQLKQLYKNDTWEILMDACSTFLYLGGGRGAYSTHKYIADLLGSATIDKKSDGIHQGTNGNQNINFDHQARELMTSEEISRMPDNDCIIFLAGEKPIYDRKYRTQDMKEFKEAKALGNYVHPVRIQKTEDGQYVTIKAQGELIPVAEERIAYYEEQAKAGANVQIFELTEEEFLQMDFSEDSPEITAEMLDAFIAPKTTELESEKSLEGSIYQCIDAYYDKLSLEQKEEIIAGLEDGLKEEDIKKYFFLPVEEMRIRRRLLRLQKD